MIGSVRGELIDRQPARTGPGAEVVVEVGGVGYRVTVAAGTAGILGETGGHVFLHVHTHVREDAIVLYGFSTRDERGCFEALLGATGVGPSLALALLTVHSPSALRRIAATDDVDGLCLVPGVGKKTAAKLLLELKSRLSGDDGLDGPVLTVVPTNGLPSSPIAEVRAALAGLGYGVEEIREATRALADDNETPVEDLLRHALKAVAR